MQYENVKKNKFQTGLTIFLFMVAIYYIIYFILKMTNIGKTGIIVAAIASFAMTFFTYWNSDKIILKTVKARKPTGMEEHYIDELLSNLCIAAGLPVRPELYIMESEQVNAFATGRNLEHSIICLTTGIIKRLDRAELEAVIGHELTHIINRDMSVSTIVSVMAGFITILADMILRFNGFNNNDSESSDRGSIIIVIIGVLALILAPIFTSLVQLFISRKREYMADAGSVGLTRNPEAMISALIRIHEDPTRMDIPTKSVQGLFISNPDPQLKKIKGESSIFSSHPTLEERVEAIRKLQ